MSSFMKQHPTLHKIADDHFGKITGALAGVAGVCAAGYLAHTLITRRRNNAFRTNINNNQQGKTQVITTLFDNACRTLCSKTSRGSRIGSKVTAEAMHAGSSDTLLTISLGTDHAQQDQLPQITLTVTDFLQNPQGHQRTYRTPFDVLSLLNRSMGDGSYAIDPYGIKHALTGHALAYPASTGGTISQPLPVFNGYIPRYRNSSLQNNPYDLYSTYTGIPSSRQVAVIDSANAFLWPNQTWDLYSKNFAALFHWATLHNKFTNGEHLFLIQQAETAARTGSSPRYNFQAASVNKTTATDEFGTTFTYQFTVAGQQKTFSVSGYQNEEAFTNDWRYVWQMIDTMSPEELRGELIIITKDAVDRHHQRGQYSSKSQRGRSQAASSVPDNTSMLTEPLPDDSSASKDNQPLDILLRAERMSATVGYYMTSRQRDSA
jgi:hypothetical protein